MDSDASKAKCGACDNLLSLGSDKPSKQCNVIGLFRRSGAIAIFYFSFSTENVGFFIFFYSSAGNEIAFSVLFIFRPKKENPFTVGLDLKMM